MEVAEGILDLWRGGGGDSRLGPDAMDAGDPVPDPVAPALRVRRAKILVVTADPRTGETLSALLGGPFELTFAPSARVADELADRRIFDLVLVDFVLPGGVHGDTVCHLLKACRSRIKILLLVPASAANELRAFADGIPADGWIRKPVTKSRLKREIFRVAGLRLEAEVLRARTPARSAAAVKSALAEKGGKPGLAAEQLGVDRSTVYRDLHRLGLRRYAKKIRRS